MTQVLDYSKVCGACSTPLTSPPRDGGGSICAYLHTSAGRGDFARIMEGNRKRQRVIDSVPEVTASPEVVTDDTEVVTHPDAVTVDEVVTLEGTNETKQQRYRRLNKERINERERDRRNHT